MGDYTLLFGPTMVREATIAQELLSTEVTYVSDLELIVKYVLVPSRKLGHKSLCYNLDNILRLHRHLILPAIQKIVNGEDYSKIGEFFAIYAPWFTLYKDYSSRFPSGKVLKKICLGDPAFANLLERVNREHFSPNTLRDYVIKPIQRLTKYELFLSQVLKTLERDDINHTITS